MAGTFICSVGQPYPWALALSGSDPWQTQLGGAEGLEETPCAAGSWVAFYKIIVRVISPHLLIPQEGLKAENKGLGTAQRAGMLHACWRGR